jgi:hypothetical protein
MTIVLLPPDLPLHQDVASAPTHLDESLTGEDRAHSNRSPVEGDEAPAFARCAV